MSSLLRKCEICREWIDPKRLAAVSQTMLCAKHAHVPLVPPPNPIMLDGIWKKQPSRTLIAILMSCWTQAFDATIAFFRGLFDLCQR